MVEPGSLVACVLKARYFRHQDVMEAGLGSNPSYLWRSLLWSRPLLENGICWHVGDGAQIDLQKDRWIPSVQGRVTQIVEHVNHKKVKDLIENERWNVSVIQQLFSSHMVQDILAIPLSSVSHEDSRYWLFDPKGKYSVREGYKSAIGVYASPASTSHNQLKSWWQFLWAFSIPPKVRIFCWRVFHNIIPTDQNLLSHHVPVSGNYPLCQSRWDSTCHALFMCPVIKSCWTKTCFWPLLKKARYLDVVDIFLWMKDKLSKEEFELFVMRAWATWCERLRLVHKDKGRLVGTNADWSETILHDFQLSQAAIYKMPESAKCKSPTVWIAPPYDQLRLDVDAAFNEGSNTYAIGSVVRNHKGQPVLVFGRKIDKPQSVTCAESSAIAGGINISHEHNLRINLVYSDSLLAVQAVTRLDENLSYVGSIASNVSILLDSHSNITLSHIRRSTNMVAHSITAFAISSPSDFVWEVGEFLLWLIHLVTKDIFST